jgi:hypothetical protein
MSCNAYRGELIELARSGRATGRADHELRAHLRQCSGCQRDFDAQVRLSEAARSLAAEAFTMAPAPEMEAVLLAEFERTLKPRVVPFVSRRWFAGIAIAASLLMGWAFWQAGERPAGTQVVKTPAKTSQELASVLRPPGGHASASERKVPAPVRRHSRQRAAPALTAHTEAEQPFVAIPYTEPLAPYERTEIVRMDLPVSALIAAGFPLEAAEPGASARADLVVSEDGRARAVRLISISDSSLNRSYK